MFENQLLKKILKILIIAVIAYAVYLTLDDQRHFAYQPQPEVEPNQAQIDSAIPLVNLEKEMPPADTIALPSHRSAAVAVVDSDSTVRYNLYREEQEIVTIDMEEHKEKVFFTWEDIRAYYYVVVDFIKELINKKS